MIKYFSAAIATLAIALISQTTFAQNIDVVRLKSGTVIRGEIQKLVPGEQIIIDDLAGNTWVFPINEVLETESAPAVLHRGGSAFHQGWVNMTTIGFLAGSSGSSQVAPFSMLTSFGYRSVSGIYTGLSAGLEFLDINHIPFQADLQYAFHGKEVSPVFILKGGYALPSKWSHDNYGNEISYLGGPVGSAGVGLKIRTKESFAWDVSLLYRYMRINSKEFQEWNDQDYEYTDIYNRLELRVGFYLD